MREPHDLIPIDTAAAELGIEPKRLRGLIARNLLHDPIGDMEYVYAWCVDRMRDKMKREQRIPEQHLTQEG